MMLTCSAACLLVLAEALAMLRRCANCLLRNSPLFALLWGAGRQQCEVAAPLQDWNFHATLPVLLFRNMGDFFFLDGEIWLFNPSHSPQNVPLHGEASSLIGLKYKFIFQTQWINIDVLKNREKLNALSPHKYNPLPDKRKIYLSI